MKQKRKCYSVLGILCVASLLLYACGKSNDSKNVDIKKTEKMNVLESEIKEQTEKEWKDYAIQTEDIEIMSLPMETECSVMEMEDKMPDSNSLMGIWEIYDESAFVRMYIWEHHLILEENQEFYTILRYSFENGIITFYNYWENGNDSIGKSVIINNDNMLMILDENEETVFEFQRVSSDCPKSNGINTGLWYNVDRTPGFCELIGKENDYFFVESIEFYSDGTYRANFYDNRTLEYVCEVQGEYYVTSDKNTLCLDRKYYYDYFAINRYMLITDANKREHEMYLSK